MIYDFIQIFLLTLLIDIFWTLYINYVGNKKAFLAGVYSALIMLGSGFVVQEYIKQPILLFGAVAGAFCGAYFIVKYKK